MTDRSDIDHARRELETALSNGDLASAAAWMRLVEVYEFTAVIEGNPIGDTAVERDEAYKAFQEWATRFEAWREAHPDQKTVNLDEIDRWWESTH